MGRLRLNPWRAGRALKVRFAVLAGGAAASAGLALTRTWRASRALRARAGVLAGGATASAGLGLAAGPAAGLMAAGVLLVAYCLLLMDVDGGGP